jgi:hypothetical protein
MEAHHANVLDKSKADVDTVLATMVSTPQLIILKQNCVTQENWSKNGVSKQVHVVVKNLVFQIEIGSAVDLNKCTLDVKLLYDTDRDDPRVEVTYIKNEPMEYKVKISESGIKATVEIRIKVLSSQVITFFPPIKANIISARRYALPGSHQCVRPDNTNNI